MNKKKSAYTLHEHVPPNWYYESVKVDPLQRFWHKKRFKEVSKLIEPVNDKVLDIGCADGVFTKVILDRSRAKQVIGIDVLGDSINWASKHWGKNKKMKFLVGEAQKLKFRPQTFDAVFVLEVLEHLYEPEASLREIKRVLKKRGYAVFLVPTDNFLFRLIWFLWLHFYPRGWVWRETHIQTYRNGFLPKLCQKVGFEVVKNHKFNLGMLQVIKVKN